MYSFALLPLLLPVQVNGPFPHENFVPYQNSTPIEEVHAGQFSDDLSLDLVVRVADRLEFINDCATTSAGWTAVPSGVVSSALLPGDGSAGSAQVIFTTDTAIFGLAKSPGQTGAFSITDQLQNSWGGRALHDGPWNGGDAVIGVAANEFGVAIPNGSSLTGVVSISYSGTLHDVDTMDWDDDGDSEIVALISNRFYVYSHTGALEYQRIGNVGGTLAISRDDGGADVAFWEIQDNGFSFILAMNSANAFNTLVQTVAGASAGLVSVDEDGDGADDLVRLHQDTPDERPGDGVVFQRISNGGPLGPSGTFGALMSSAGSFTTAETCHTVALSAAVVGSTSGDFDNDGDEDVLIALTQPVEGPSLRLRVNDTEDVEQLNLYWDHQPPPVIVNEVVEAATLDFEEPLDTTIFDTMTHLEVRMWKRASASGSPNLTYLPGSGQPELVAIDHQTTPSPTMTVQLDTGYTALLQTDIRVYSITMLELDSSGNVLSQGPRTVIFFRPQNVYELLVSFPLGCFSYGDPGSLEGQLSGGRGGTGNPPNPNNP